MGVEIRRRSRDRRVRNLARQKFGKLTGELNNQKGVISLKSMKYMGTVTMIARKGVLTERVLKKHAENAGFTFDKVEYDR